MTATADRMVGQGMGEITLYMICQEAWEQGPGDLPWTEVGAEGQAEYAREARCILEAAANRMPADIPYVASAWLRGEV